MNQAEPAIDPMMAGFDRVVALAGYGLLFASVFMLGVPALAAFVLALAHRRDAHPVARSHFRFQLRIFYGAILSVAFGAAALIASSGWAVSRLIAFIQGGHATTSPGGLAAALLAAGVLFFILAAIWLLGASVFGFLRLASGHPIGAAR